MKHYWVLERLQPVKFVLAMNHCCDIPLDSGHCTWYTTPERVSTTTTPTAEVTLPVLLRSRAVPKFTLPFQGRLFRVAKDNVTVHVTFMAKLFSLIIQRSLSHPNSLLSYNVNTNVVCMTRQSVREWTFSVLNSNTIYCSIIFENRTRSEKLIKFLYKLN